MEFSNATHRLPVTITIGNKADVNIPPVVSSSNTPDSGDYRLVNLHAEALQLRATCAEAEKYAKMYKNRKNWLGTLLYWFFKTGMLAIKAAAKAGNANAKSELLLTDLSEMISEAYDKATKATADKPASDKPASAAPPVATPKAGDKSAGGKYAKK